MSLRSWPLVAAVALVAAPTARADKLDKDSKKWLEEIAPILLPEEEKIFKDLKDKGERDEFRKIFWARRDPDLQTPKNEYQVEYERLREEADQKFRVGGPGSLNDCGRTYILLGPPDEVKKLDAGGELALRQPEAWTYRDRPGFTFKDGKIEISFDGSCRFPQGSGMQSQLDRVAEGRVVNPSLGYSKGPDRKLVKLADQLPKPTPVLALIKEPRQDFPAAAENVLVMRTPEGATYVAGLVRLEPGAVTVEESGGSKVAKVSVGLQAVEDSGRVAASTSRDVEVAVGADGALVVSYGTTLRPGAYDLKVGVLDSKGGKGSVVSRKLEAPDFEGEDLAVSPLLVLRDIQEMPAREQDALAAFQLGPMRMLPSYGNVFTREESITLLTFLYHPKVSEETGKPSATVSFQILKDGKPVAKAPDQEFDAAGAGPSVGPVPLSAYEPGTYTAQVKVTDNVAKATITREATFELR